MEKGTVRRAAGLLLAAELCLLAAAPAMGWSWENAVPAVQTNYDPRYDGAYLEKVRLRRIQALLEPYGLTREQEQALCTRLAEDGALLTLLSGGELTGADLICLALPNGRTDRLDRYSAWAASSPELSAEEVVFQVNLDRDRSFYSDIQTAEGPYSAGVLVNKHYRLPDGFAPALEALGAGYGAGSLQPEAARAFRAMADAAGKAGVTLRSVSAYRSYETQANLYRRYMQRYGNRQSMVDGFSARAGHSEHQTGLALDINVASFQAHFENTPAFAWLKAHCAEYGFILRYTRDKQNITGFRFEPWHYRYVGREAARVCMDQGLSYEEYLALQPG